MLVQAICKLPYLLWIPDGKYGELELKQLSSAQPLAPSELTQIKFEFEDELTTSDQEQRQLLALRKVGELLNKINLLLRWYRVLTAQASVTELTRVQISPIEFFINQSEQYLTQPLTFENNIRQYENLSQSELAFRIRQGLQNGSEPNVADLFLLDAETAKRMGRFREAVLFSWSTIDSIFNSKYNQLVAQKLSSELSDSRDYLQGKKGELPLKVKMTVMLTLLTGRSLYTESNASQWQALMESYKCRNKIIHEGRIAHENDADQAISSARWVVNHGKHIK